MTQQPSPPLGGDEAVAWRWRFDGDSSGPWHYGSKRPGKFRFGDPEEVQPLYAAPVLPVEVREKIERAGLWANLPDDKSIGRMNALDAFEAGKRAATNAILSTIKGEA